MVFLFFSHPKTTNDEVHVANFIALSKNHKQRVDELAARLTRVEIHIRRGERRAARARLIGFYEEADALLGELELPMDFVIAGANIGLLSGKGSWLRGRLPAVVLGATAGWMAGQASVMRNRRYIEELVIHSQQLELLLEQTAP